MAYYGEAAPSVVVTGGGSKASSAISTIADSASKIYQNTKEKSAGSKLGKKLVTLIGANEGARVLGFDNIIDAAGKGVGFVGDKATELGKALGGIQAPTAETIQSTIHGVSDKLSEASKAYENSILGGLHLSDDLKAFTKGITDNGSAVQGPITKYVNKGYGSTGRQTYLDELTVAGLGTLAAAGVIKGAKALTKRHIYKKDRAVEHKHDLDLAKELKKVDTRDMMLASKAKDFKL